jgi:lipopolysaccharide/colanic/teichoic acid biosynthesis glycosyltransferase
MTFRSKRLAQVFLFLIPSLFLMYLGLYLTLMIWYPDGLSDAVLSDHYVLFSIVFAGWLFVLVALRVVDAWHHAHIRSFFTAFVLAMHLNALFAVVVFYIQPDLLITPRRFLLVLVLIVSFFLFVWISTMRQVMRRMGVAPVYFLSLEKEFEELSSCEESGLNRSFFLAGNLTIDGFSDTAFAMNPEQIWIVVPPQQSLPGLLLERLSELQRKGATIIPYAEFYEQYFRRISLQVLNDWWFITDVHPKRTYEIMKRFFDLLLGFALFLVFLVTLPVVGVFVKLSGPGPIFFKQERHSLDGRRFQIVKYRTMKHGTASDTWTEKGDVRITPIGRWLRKTRLDELPQCLNVLRGDMSFVGPRPEQAQIAERLSDLIPFYGRRTQIRPGLVGWAQLYVYASTEEETRKKLQYDLYYLKHRSLMFDLEILVKTVLHLLRFSGR